jgi:hypothetical protein
MHHDACNALSVRLLQLIALTIEILDWDSNFEPLVSLPSDPNETD